MTRRKIDPMVRFPALLQMLGLSEATVYRMMARGEFPQSIKLIGARPGKKSPVGWPLSQVQAYLRKRAAASIQDAIDSAPPVQAAAATAPDHQGGQFHG